MTFTLPDMYGPPAAPPARSSFPLQPFVPHARALPEPRATALRALTTQQTRLTAAVAAGERRLRTLAERRAELAALDADAACFCDGMPTQLERLQRIDTDVAAARSAATAATVELKQTNAELEAARSDLRAIARRELQSLAREVDQLLRQAEAISDHADAVEAEASELGLVPNHQYHSDPLVHGGWSYLRRGPIAVHPDGRRSVATGGESEYRAERARKVAIGLL